MPLFAINADVSGIAKSLARIANSLEQILDVLVFPEHRPKYRDTGRDKRKPTGPDGVGQVTDESLWEMELEDELRRDPELAEKLAAPETEQTQAETS